MKKTQKIHIKKSQVDRLISDVIGLPISPIGDHLSDNEFFGYVKETLPDNQIKNIDNHLNSCSKCASKMERLFEKPEALRGEKGELEFASLRQRIFDTAQLSDILDRIAELLRDKDLDVRSASADAVGALGRSASRSEILDRLSELLQDSDDKIRKAAKDAIEIIRDSTVRLEEQLKKLQAFLDRHFGPVPIALGFAFQDRAPLDFESEDGTYGVFIEEKPNGDVKVYFDSTATELEGVTIRLYAGKWSKDVQLTKVDDTQLGAKITITRAEREAMPNGAVLRAKLVDEDSVNQCPLSE